ncbi:hypothetical protein Agub_g10118 [Astrephomene gubernaculifera]|uniref:Uncharacterized protein n=1 Tax=Astrephomene gubernaculifera TaxID=47775 RepID=A0AAD3DUU0_9CHLO|nr:hypothetical protein Agub_g10118 [Astrephomene gubernaculifera]
MALPSLLLSQQHDEDAEQKDLLSAATAFFKWRQAALKANFRRELEGILEEVAQEEEAASRVQKQLARTQERLDETTQALSKLSNDHRTALVHIDQLRAQNEELFRALEAAEGASRSNAEQARTANTMHQEEVRRRQDEAKRYDMELEALRDQCQTLVAQQQVLLDSMAQRDREVAEANQEGLHQKRNAARLQEEVERLEALARATGERAAAAEAQAAARSETIAKLYAELSGLRERYHAELSELKAARMAASDVQRMRERMDSMQAVNDSLVAARDELRASLEGVAAKLAAAEQRLKRQAAAATMRETILDAVASIGRELVGEGDESHTLQVTTRLSTELDMAMTSNTDLAERLTSAEAVIAQQQGHVRRMAEECSSLEAQLRESRQQRDAQHRINAELAAELKRLAAESALGPILVLDREGNLVPQAPPQPPPPAATSPATSQLEAQSTAVRVILADKAFGLGALCQAIAAHPGSVQAVRAQLGECRALAESLRVDVEEVGALLAARPFEAEELARKLPALQDRLSKTESCLVAAREELTSKQVHAVSLEARVLAAESALRGGASLLQGWSGLLSEVAAAEDGRLEPDVRLGLREELKTREDALHRAVLDLAAAAPPLLGGDPGYAAAQVAMREAGNAMMELALTLGDRLVDAPATRTRVLSAEHLLLDRAAALARFRELLARAPGEIADMVERLTAIIPDLQAIGPAVEEMLRCVQHYLAADKEAVVDVVALQGEVLMLRGLVRNKDMAIQALEAAGAGIRTGSPTKRAVKMVPLEALHAAERVRDGVAGEKAALQSRMVDQRVQLVAARHRLVNYMASLRQACEMAEVFYKWRTAAAVIKAERSHAEMVAAQRELQRVEQETREQLARMEADMEAARARHADEVASLSANHLAEVAALNKAHAAAVTSLQEAHAEERRRAALMALEAAKSRVRTLRRVMKEKTERWEESLAYSVLYFWRFRVRRQVMARQRLRDYSTRLRAREEPENLTYKEILYGPRMTVARRAALRHKDPSDLRTPQAVTGAQVARMVLQAWRGWAYVKRQAHKVEALTEAVPTFIENLGDRRRLERAWLGLRLWTTGCATARAHDAIRDYEAATAEAQAAKVAAERAVAEMEEERQRQAVLAEEAAAEAAVRAQELTLNPYGFLPGPPLEVGTQYLPNVHTLLLPGAQAPEHSAAEDAVAAVRAAGMATAVQPVNAALQLPAAAPVGNLPGWAAFTPGEVMPPVAGPSQAAINALARQRATAPGARSLQAVEPSHGRTVAPGGGVMGGGAAARAASSGRVPPPGRGPLKQVSDNQGGRARQRGSSGGGAGKAKAAANQTSTAGVASRSVEGTASGVATLAERAERLVRAVDAITAGVAGTADLLVQRTKVLQMDAEDAVPFDETVDRALVQSAAAATAEDGSPVSLPTRRVQSDGTVAIEYHQQPHGPIVSPPESPTVVRAGRHLEPKPVAWPTSGEDGAQQHAQTTVTVDGGSEAGGAGSPGPVDATTTGPSESAEAAGPKQTQGTSRPQNGVQLLLGRATGRGRDQSDGRRAQAANGTLAPQPGTVSGAPARGTAGRRIHNAAPGGSLAKGRLSARPAPGPPSSALVPAAAPVTVLLPRTVSVPRAVTAAQVEAMAAGASASQPQVHSVWPHVPANALSTTGPNTAELMRRRGEQIPEPLAPYSPASGAPAAITSSQVPPLAPPPQAPMQTPLPAPAPAVARVGKVVRFERMTPPPNAGPNAPSSWPAEQQGPDGYLGPEPSLGMEDRGPATYIQLPSPVKATVRLPGGGV